MLYTSIYKLTFLNVPEVSGALVPIMQICRITLDLLFP